MSLVQGFGTVYLILVFKKVLKILKEATNTQILLLSSALLYFLSNFYIEDVYDRYIVVPTVLLISLIVVIYTIISHLVNWMIRLLHDGDTEGLIVLVVFVYVVFFIGTISILSNLIVLTP